MRIAIGLTLLLGAAAMLALFVINHRQFRLTAHRRSRSAMIVSAVIAAWCALAAIWIFSQDW